MPNMTLLELPIRTNESGELLLKLALIEGDGDTFSVLNHSRAVIYPSDDPASIDATISDLNQALTDYTVVGGRKAGFSALGQGAVAKIHEAAAVHWTPEIKARARQKIAADAALAEAAKKEREELMEAHQQNLAERVADVLAQRGLVTKGNLA